jgi:excinuclease ABC subunit A
VLDEPTTGLHFEDIRKLLLVLGRLVDQGNTVLVIEHNLDVIKTADWLVDMGPEGGSRGGIVVAEGTPEDVAANPDSFTGQFLAPVLEGRAVKQPSRRATARKEPAKRAPTRKAAATKAPAKKAAAKKAPARKAPTAQAPAERAARRKAG